MGKIHGIYTILLYVRTVRIYIHYVKNCWMKLHDIASGKRLQLERSTMPFFYGTFSITNSWKYHGVA